MKSSGFILENQELQELNSTLALRKNKEIILQEIGKSYMYCDICYKSLTLSVTYNLVVVEKHEL